MNSAKASVILERALVRIATAAKREQEAINQKLTGEAIALNMSENLVSIKWNKKAKCIEIIPVKSTKYLY